MKFDQNLVMEIKVIGSAQKLSLCVHTGAKSLSNKFYFVLLVVSKQDLKFEHNPFMDSGDIDRAR